MAISRLVLVALLALPLISQTPNTLTPAERKAGWTLLFDGRSYANWKDPGATQPAGDSWTIEDGSLKTKAHPRITEDLVSTGTYRDFELAWDWKIAPGGNSGIKYRIQDFVVLAPFNHNPNAKRFEDTVDYVMTKNLSDRSKIAPNDKAQVYVVGFEYQMIDDQRHPDAKRGDKHVAGSLYDMIAPSSHPAKPAGEWNSSRLIVKGDHIEHWLNGVKVVDGTLRDPAVASNSATRWHEGSPMYKLLVDQPKKECPISLQNHGDEAWFRNIRIRRL